MTSMVLHWLGMFEAKWPQVSLRDLALTLIGTFFAGMVEPWKHIEGCTSTKREVHCCHS